MEGYKIFGLNNILFSSIQYFIPQSNKKVNYGTGRDGK